jgi:hypothetical protein
MQSNHKGLCSAFQAGQFKNWLWDIKKGPVWCWAMFAIDEVLFWYTAVKDSHVYSGVFYVGPAVNAFSYRITS